MAGILRNDSTEEGRAIWQAVDKAASKAPEWARRKIENAPMQTNRDQTEPQLTERSSQ
jgi:hypothetical protein